MRKTLTNGILMLAVLFCAASALAQAAEAEWPTFRGPNHDGKSPDTGLLKEWPAEGPALLWKADGIGKGFSTVSVAGGAIYTSGDVGDSLVLSAFNMNGAPKWKATVGPAWTQSKPGSRATPTIDGGNLYILSGTGVLGCYDAKSGAPKWQKNVSDFGGKAVGWGYAESPLILGDRLIFKPGGQNFIVALDKATGETVWQSVGYNSKPEYSDCLPFTHGGQELIATGTKSGIVCVKAADGAVVWSNSFCSGNTANCPTPAYSDGYIFWSNGYGKGGICLKLDDAGQATEAWKTKDLVCHHGGYVIEKGYIYGNHGGGYSCLELKTGKKMWNESAVGKGSLCWADGMLYLFGENGGKAALATCSPDGLEVKGSVTVAGSGTSWAHPVVIGGRLYLRYDQNLYCFDVKAK